MLHPIHSLAVELLLDCNVRYRCRRRRSVPVLLSGSEPDNVTRPYLLDWTAPALRPSAPRSNNQYLPKRMRVPSGSCARLKSDTCAHHPSRIRRGKQRIDPYRTSEPVGWSLTRRLGPASLYLHCLSSSPIVSEALSQECLRSSRSQQNPNKKATLHIAGVGTVTPILH